MWSCVKSCDNHKIYVIARGVLILYTFLYVCTEHGEKIDMERVIS